MNILVLTTRNIYGNSGEKTLMLAKDKELKKYNYDLFYYSFRRKFDNDDKSFNIIKKDKMFDLIYRRKNIYKNIQKLIEDNQIDIIVISGNWLLFLYSELKEIKEKYNIKISYDYQGAIEEVQEYKLFKNNSILSNILYQVLKYYENKFLDVIDGIETVSNNALEHLKYKYAKSEKYKSVLVHCGIEYPISYDNWKEYRKIYRKKYMLKDSDVAYVYAGGILPWQNIDQIIDVAVKDKNIILYIYTSVKNQNILKSKYNLTNNIKFDFLSHEELQHALCAFDYGLLLRNNDITNYVAFPNKYSDYINARLKVLVKNTNIGYYPIDKKRQEVIIKLQDRLTFSNKLDNSIYDDYIYSLQYNVMIKQLIIYYEEL